jgi:hypothetical protein
MHFPLTPSIPWTFIPASIFFSDHLEIGSWSGVSCPLHYLKRRPSRTPVRFSCFAVTLDEAKAEFAKSWPFWLEAAIESRHDRLRAQTH